ncbi:MAG: hypothetical protein ABI947_17820 [Chloroflexota bacterium]
MSQFEFLKARGLINEKRYADARIVLKRINDPKAAEWLAKLDKIDPPSDVPETEAEIENKQLNLQQWIQIEKKVGLATGLLLYALAGSQILSAIPKLFEAFSKNVDNGSILFNLFTALFCLGVGTRAIWRTLQEDRLERMVINLKTGNQRLVAILCALVSGGFLIFALGSPIALFDAILFGCVAALWWWRADQALKI